MTKEDLVRIAKRINNEKEYGMRKRLFEELKRISGAARLSRRTVDGWFIGRPIERFWEAQIERLESGEITLSRDDIARIRAWFKKLDPAVITQKDRKLFERLS